MLNRHDSAVILEVLNYFIDDRINAFGIKNTIRYLLDSGCTVDLLVVLDFDRWDVEKIAEEFYKENENEEENDE